MLEFQQFLKTLINLVLMVKLQNKGILPTGKLNCYTDN